ncbi:MAG TPA: diphthamide synthesis protein [Candidatus Paceibacterota bacterium]|nr:diphthamide synthesis protein [Candidatus Paceibacterota bacterium]
MTKTIFIDAKYSEEIGLTNEVLNYLKSNNIKSVSLFASVQFLNLETIKKQLKSEKISIKTTKAKRTNKEIQVLGCNVYEDSFKTNIIKNSDAILYIGDGLFHPKAILISQINTQNKKKIIQFNPVSKQFRIINEEFIETEEKRIQANLRKFINSNKIGIIVSTKPGQNFMNLSLKLKEDLEKKGKKVFIFVSDTIDLNDLENFSFIESWVNSACPRIAIDNLTNKKIINIKEAFNPTKFISN